MYLGNDFGTSGCRAVVINDAREIISEASLALPAPQLIDGRIQQQASVWIEGLQHLLQKLASQLELKQIRRIAIDGTSATLLLCDDQGTPLTPALMYNDSSSRGRIPQIRQHCPTSQHVTMSSSAALPKALQLLQGFESGRIRILHQADYLSNTLCQRWGYSDYHNALKLGYDPLLMAWPEWVKQLLPAQALPEVLAPGEIIGPLDSAIAQQYGFSPDCRVCAGSTDANAAFIATSSTRPGDAVTSLGSTLVIKILNQQPIQDLDSGVYSHKLGDLWLVGGSSNAGARILREYFSDQQIAEYSSRMDLQQSTGLNYYPLSTAGERFPYNEPDKQPQLSPRPLSDVVFLQGLLEGLSEIEKTGYDRLVSLGASQPTRIQTCGGGARNPQWSAMRSRLLDIPVSAAQQTEACYGSALLALEGLQRYTR